MSLEHLDADQIQWEWPVSDAGRFALGGDRADIELSIVLFPVFPHIALKLDHEPTAVMITDLEYPYRPAFSLLTKILDENAPLLAQLPSPSAAPSFGSASANAFGGNPSQAAAGGLPPAQKGKLERTLSTYLTKYQDPKQADTIMKVQKELDETKIVLVRDSR